MAILQAIIAIPTLISRIEALLAYFEKAETEKWFQRSSEVFAAIQPGTTSEQKFEQAKAVQDITSHL